MTDDLAAEGDHVTAFKRAAVLAYYGVTPKSREQRQHCPICGGFLRRGDGSGTWKCGRCGSGGDLGD